MAEFKISGYIIGIILFTFLIVGGISLMSIFKDSDPTYASDEKFSQFNDTFNVYQETTSKANDLGAVISNNETNDYGALGAIGSFTVVIWQSLKLMGSNWSFMLAVYQGISSIFMIPAWITNLLILAISVLLIFALFSAFFYRQM